MTSVFVFISGAALLIYSAEKLIGYLIGIASILRVSVFLLAIVFTGIEFDDVFLGLALNLEDLDDVALGLVFGTALSMTGVVLALAAILTPTKVTIPRDYIWMLAAAPLIMIPLTLMAPLTAVHGVLLLVIMVVVFGYIAYRETRRDTPVFRDAEVLETYGSAALSAGGAAGGTSTALADPPTRDADVGSGVPPKHPSHSLSENLPESSPENIPYGQPSTRSGIARIGLAVLALIGLVIGAATTGIGTDGILDTYGLEGTLFGATIATAVLTIEDIFLTVEPIRRGVPEIGIGNVIGSVLFSVTGKLGIILLAGGIVIESNVLAWHLPALIISTALGAWFISTGKLQRWHGYVLIGLYIAYWVGSFLLFGEPPVEQD